MICVIIPLFTIFVIPFSSKQTIFEYGQRKQHCNDKCRFNCNCDKKTWASFTRTVNVTVFVSGTFDVFDVACKQHHRTALNLFYRPQKKLREGNVFKPVCYFVSRGG